MSIPTEKTEFEKMLERKVAEEAALKAQSEVNAADAGDDAADAAAETASAEATSELETLRSQLQEKEQTCAQLQDQMLRARADFDNYRKRLLREMDQLRQTASANLIRSLLPVLDDLERALEHAEASDGFTEGVRMICKQFQEKLSAEGLEPIPAVNEVFDPNLHDALAMMSSETVESGRVIEEYERGYRLRDFIVRPARVVVSSGAPESGDAVSEIQDDIPPSPVDEGTLSAEQ